ncbi:MAG: hypothetical protein DRO15_04270 [Thermoprotei archaeon]|nr:MAG: hypothetical protein DRO15_04270 [Thermoprotei archaeon]
MKSYIKRMLPIMIGIVLSFLVPVMVGFDEFYILLATTILVYSVVASAWNIIGGFGGQLDLGAAAYLGLGAFITGNLLLKFGITPWIGMFIGGITATAVAIVIGYPTFRLGVKGVWYALSTISVVYILQTLFLMWEEVGGPVEKWLPRGEASLYYLSFRTYIPYYYIALVFLIITLIINRLVEHSRLGYSLKALAYDEDAAMSLGINVQRTKLKALMIYSFIVGTFGGFYVCFTGFMHPVVDFSIPFSIEIVVLGIVGGLGTIYGPLLASLILVSLKEYLRGTFGAIIMGIYPAIYAIALILIILFAPQGLASVLKEAFYFIITKLRIRTMRGG